jgi:hypothetical protein
MQKKIAIIVDDNDKNIDLSSIIHNNTHSEIWCLGNYKKSNVLFKTFSDFIKHFSYVWQEYSWTIHLNSRVIIDAKNTEKLLNSYFNFSIPVNVTGELEWQYYAKETLDNGRLIDIHCNLPQSSINVISNGAWAKIFSSDIWENSGQTLLKKRIESLYGVMCYAHKIPVSNVCFLTTKKLEKEFTLHNKNGKCSLIGA